MINEWRQFLEDAGAEFDDGCVLTFGNPDLERRIVTTADVFCDLSHHGLIRAEGPDARDFLHAQFTNDVRNLPPGHAQLNSYLSPKGRVLAIFYLFAYAGAEHLLLPSALLAPTLTRLQQFVLRAKVALRDASDDCVRLGLSGPNIAAELEQALGAPPPAEPYRVAAHDGVTAVRIEGPHPRFVLLGPVERMRRVWEHLNVRCAPVGGGPWRLLDIRAGIPYLTPETVDRFVPQMLNLERLGAVSFTKGCYPGQEIVARTQHLGEVKRRLYQATVRASRPPPPGEEIVRASDGGAAAVGQVIDAQLSAEGGYEMLAVLLIEAARQGGLHLKDLKGPEVQLRDQG